MHSLSMGPKQTKYVTRTVLERNNRELKQAIDDLPFPRNPEHEVLTSGCETLMLKAIENNTELLVELMALDNNHK